VSFGNGRRFFSCTLSVRAGRRGRACASAWRRPLSGHGLALRPNGRERLMGELRGVPIPVCVLRMCAVRVTLYAVGVRCPRGGCVWGGRVALCSAPVPGPRSVLCVRAGGPDLFPLRGKKVPCELCFFDIAFCHAFCVKVWLPSRARGCCSPAPAAAAGAPGPAARANNRTGNERRSTRGCKNRKIEDFYLASLVRISFLSFTTYGRRRSNTS
jgi:hypothetical protein